MRFCAFKILAVNIYVTEETCKSESINIYTFKHVKQLNDNDFIIISKNFGRAKKILPF